MKLLSQFLKIRRNLFILIVIFLVGIAVWYRMTHTSQPISRQITVQKGNLKQELTLSGSIDATEHVTLTFQTAGLLSWVGVAEGDTVSKGQAIASLDQRALKKTFQKYLNTYTKTRQDFDQTKDTYKDNDKTDSIKRVLEKSQVDLDNAVTDVELQDISVRLATLTTPIDGVVTHVTTPFAGVNITPTGTNFEIVNPATLYMKVTADQTEVIHLHPGQRATITLDPYPDQTYSGSIQNISYTPSTTETGTSYEIKLLIPQLATRDSFRIGMTGDVTFTTNSRFNVLYIPLEYVKSDEKGKYVFIDQKGTKKYIKTGLETEDAIEITEGLHKGDIVYDRT